jgi:hypothetical protein
MQPNENIPFSCAKRFRILSIFICIFLLPLLTYSALMLSNSCPTCSAHDCFSQLSGHTGALTCLIKVLETNETFTKFCWWYEGCRHINCPEYATCYLNDGRISFDGCPMNRVYIWIFLMSIFGELISIPFMVYWWTGQTGRTGQTGNYI